MQAEGTCVDSQGAHRPPTGMSPPCLIDFRIPTSHFTSVAVRRLGRRLRSGGVLRRPGDTNSNDYVRQPLPLPVRNMLREHPLLTRAGRQDDVRADGRDSGAGSSLAECGRQA